ncbi:MAG: XkdX family protein [Bacteroidaceae bacterium]|nr:XkdX family protein [Bacteroidaceae bacterium]
MSKYERIKKYYDEGLWNIDRVRDAVTKGFITEDQFEEITRQTYDQQ